MEQLGEFNKFSDFAFSIHLDRCVCVLVNYEQKTLLNAGNCYSEVQ